MMALSVLIASLGLMADNASVVIGAMLVAPFMAPLIGVGLALSQGNLALMKRSALATAAGLAVGLSLSFVLGLLVPLDELPLEALSRGDPDIVDMAIASPSQNQSSASQLRRHCFRLWHVLESCWKMGIY